MNDTGIMAVPDAMKDSAGVIVWWELSGVVDLDDMREAIDQADGGMNAAQLETWMPEEPSLVIALGRAASAALPSKRHLLRPLNQRGSWEITLEHVDLEEDQVDQTRAERLRHQRLLSGRVEDGKPVLEGPDEDLKAAVLGKVGFYKRVLTTTDFSNWLLVRAGDLHAIGLRSRGGFYFVPKDKVEEWRRIVAIVRACSGHAVYEMPAMKTKEAVAAILASLRNEATKQFNVVETYLAAGDSSTRGLNSATRTADELRAKLAHYSELLGAQLGDLDQRLIALTGAIQAARIVESADGVSANNG